ncbi:hypothetical protein Vretimale_7057, partial [Volvox reticuliferus]
REAVVFLRGCLALPPRRHAAVVVSRRHRDFFTCVFRVFPACLCCPRHLCKRPFLFCLICVSFAVSDMHLTSAAQVRPLSAAAGSQLWRHWLRVRMLATLARKLERCLAAGADMSLVASGWVV